MSKARVAERPRAEYGSDVVVDMLKSFGVEYVALNPGASFRGLHDSLVNYGGNHMPEVLTCTHEEIAVAMAHGYARAKGRPMGAALHNIVGLQHASMAIFNAWCDRLPIIVMGGTGPMDSAHRRPWIDWVHTALVQGTQVRDYVKWDDQPASVEAIPESFIRAYRLATTDPMGPVYLCYDGDVQEKKIEGNFSLPSLGRYPSPLSFQAPEEGFSQTIRWLLEARAPVVIADWVGRKEAGFKALLELADLLGIAVLDRGGRFNFPMDHVLNLTSLEAKVLPRADLVLALDVPDLEGATTRLIQEEGKRIPTRLMPEGTKTISVGLEDLSVRSWCTDFNRLREVDLSIPADTGVFLPELVRRLRDEKEAVKKLQADIETRKAGWSKLRAEKDEAMARETKARWDEKPISTSRLYTEVAQAVKDEDWVLTSGTSGFRETHYIQGNKFNQVLGKNKGAGLGYGLPASLGASLAHKGSGKVCVDIQPDGDLLFTISGLWTAAHHAIPLLMVVCSNRSYYNDEEHQERVARMRGRPVENKTIGIRIEDPTVDFATMARCYGHPGIGPITEPGELGKALRDGLRLVKDEGKLVLVDVVCQSR